MSRKLQVKRGHAANLPTLAEGEFGFVTDEKKLYIGDGSNNLQLANADLSNVSGEDLKSKAEAAGIGGSSVFIAEYSVTTLNEIVNAYNEGKAVLLGTNINNAKIKAYLSALMVLSNERIVGALFVCPHSSSIYEYSVNSNNYWSENINSLAKNDLSNVSDTDFKAKVDVAGVAQTKTYEVSVNTIWTVDTVTGIYSTTVPVAGILGSDNPIVDIVLGDDDVENENLLKIWGKIIRIVTATNKITITSKTEPTSAFSIQLKVVR